MTAPSPSFAENAQNTAIRVDNVTKRFGTYSALDHVSLDVAANEFFTLLGPSGCGKTTLLRLIAGFDYPTTGEILLYGKPQAGLPPHLREINTVFQNYALFPLMSVRSNVEFGLLRLGWSRDKAKARALTVLEMVHMAEFAERFPGQLSGGQQQRVALARALAPKPRVLLLDEPLSALDLKLRQKVRLELKSLQRDTGITFIFVTHDQEEALTMSDRIAVMSNGHVQQVGTPDEIYSRPRNHFVADFIGDTNLLDVELLDGPDGKTHAKFAGSTVFAVEGDRVPGAHKATVSIRPENLRLCAADVAHLSGTVRQKIFIGTDILVSVTLASGLDVTARVQAHDAKSLPEVGQAAHFHLRDGGARLLVN